MLDKKRMLAIERMLTIKERMLAVSDLKLAEKIGKMNEAQMNRYEHELHAFIDSFPEDEKKLKAALEAKDYDTLLKRIGGIRETLKRIHANDAADDCLRHIGELKNAKHEKIEAYVTYFLASTSMLSIDIQMAIYGDDPRTDEEKKEKAPAGGVKDIKTILAVDDSTVFLNMLKTFVQEEASYEITCVKSGVAALTFLANHQPDLFILDIEMPNMNGYELAEKIRASGQKAPIIFLTANSTKEYVIKAIKVGASDFMVKPIDKAHVLSRISKHL